LKGWQVRARGCTATRSAWAARAAGSSYATPVSTGGARQTRRRSLALTTPSSVPLTVAATFYPPPTALCLAQPIAATLTLAELLDVSIPADALGPHAGATFTAMLLVAGPTIAPGSVCAWYGSSFGAQRTWVVAPPCPSPKGLDVEDLTEFLDRWHLSVDEITHWCVRRDVDAADVEVEDDLYPATQPPTAIVAPLEPGVDDAVPWGVARTVVRAGVATARPMQIVAGLKPCPRRKVPWGAESTMVRAAAAAAGRRRASTHAASATPPPRTLDSFPCGWFVRVPRTGDGEVLFWTWCRIVRHQDGKLVVSVPGEANQSVSLRIVDGQARPEAPPMHVEGDGDSDEQARAAP